MVMVFGLIFAMGFTMGTLFVMRSMFHLINVCINSSSEVCADMVHLMKYRKNRTLYGCMYHLHQLDPIHMFVMMLHGE